MVDCKIPAAHAILRIRIARFSGGFGEDTHQKKRKASPGIGAKSHEGRTPIIKNIEVRDPSGKLYSPTYPTRAKGLVKQGRARWIGKDAIELTAPPSEFKEDLNMTEDININSTMNDAREPASGAALPDGMDYTTRDLIDAMVAILKRNEIASQITEATKSIYENWDAGESEELPDIDPLTQLAMGFKENQRYALAIIERMYKGIHPEAYEDPNKGAMRDVYAAMGKRIGR